MIEIFARVNEVKELQLKQIRKVKQYMMIVSIITIGGLISCYAAMVVFRIFVIDDDHTKLSHILDIVLDVDIIIVYAISIRKLDKTI